MPLKPDEFKKAQRPTEERVLEFLRASTAARCRVDEFVTVDAPLSGLLSKTFRVTLIGDALH